MVFSLAKFKAKYPHLADSQNPLEHIEGWERGCENIKYVQNNINRINNANGNVETKVFD